MALDRKAYNSRNGPSNQIRTHLPFQTRSGATESAQGGRADRWNARCQLCSLGRSPAPGRTRCTPCNLSPSARVCVPHPTWASPPPTPPGPTWTLPWLRSRYARIHAYTAQARILIHTIADEEARRLYLCMRVTVCTCFPCLPLRFHHPLTS